jgi:hypothetical protein
MRRPFIACLLVLSLAAFTLPHRAASAAAAARPPHATGQGRKAIKKKKGDRPQKVKASKPKPDKKKNDPGFAL